MSHLKRFSYADISGRWMIYSFVFLLFSVTIFQVSDAIISLKQFLPYYPSTTIIFISSLFALFAGNLAGRLIYSFFKKYFIINILVTLLFIASVSFYYIKNIYPGFNYSNFDLYLLNRYLLLTIIILPSFFTGILNTYFLKICSGDFVDEINLLNQYHIALFSSIATAVFLNILAYVKEINLLYAPVIILIISVILIIFSFFIKYPYMHEVLVARHYHDDEPPEETDLINRDDLLFTYSSFSFILIYIFLGYIAFIKFYNNSYLYSLLYAGSVSTAIIIGYAAGRLNKHSFWYVYSEMLYPIFFLAGLFLQYHFEGKFNFVYGLLFASIPSVIFGFSLSSTVYNIVNKYDHQQRFNILNFSLFILPFPIIFAVCLLTFSYLTFFTLLYIISLVNLIIPGMFLINLKTGYIKKFLYFILTLAVIPVIILFHLYFKIPINTKLFNTNTQNFETLKETNFNMPYISEKEEIRLSGVTAFFLSESTIRNHKRAVASTLLFVKPDTRGLIIDGNQKFFRNPVFGIFKNALCLDVIQSKEVDWNRLPESGRQLYQPIETEPLKFLSASRDRYEFIIDYPNLLDQNAFRFKYSSPYFKSVLMHLTSTGRYISILDIQFADSRHINYLVENLSATFKYHSIFLFSNILVIISANDNNSVTLDEESLARIESIIQNEENYGLLFFSSVQPLNYYITSDLALFTKFIPADGSGRHLSLQSPVLKNIIPDFENYYLNIQPDFSAIVPREKLGWQAESKIKSDYARQKSILELIKDTEYAESTNSYLKETDFLFQLKRYGSYNSDLKAYVDKILGYKEKFYFSEALRLEKQKKWDDAAILYRAILTINENNFDANYHFGLLYITMQDLDNAFKYLDAALKLNKEHPQVLYQMGILMFSSNKIKEAISYFEKAEQLKLNIYQLYMYLGLSYEQTGNLEKAREYYEKAILLDPNDKKLRSLLQGVDDKIKEKQVIIEEGAKSNMIDDEQGVNMAIPVNKKAVKARLLDEE